MNESIVSNVSLENENSNLSSVSDEEMRSETPVAKQYEYILRFADEQSNKRFVYNSGYHNDHVFNKDFY